MELRKWPSRQTADATYTVFVENSENRQDTVPERSILQTKRLLRNKGAISAVVQWRKQLIARFASVALV